MCLKRPVRWAVALVLVACSNEGVAFKKAEQSYAIGEYYYDAKTGKRLGYGDIEAKSGYTFTVSLSDWENVVEKTVSTVLENTPIKK